MKRTDRYPDTETFHWYNANPKGRITGDCTFRAIATAMGKTWKDVVMEMAEMSCRTGYAINDTKGIERYLAEHGWIKHQQPRKEDNTKYTGAEFCEYLYDYSDISFAPYNIDGNVIANIGGHHVTVFVSEGYGKYRCYDIWDCTSKCIGNYWVKKSG